MIGLLLGLLIPSYSQAQQNTSPSLVVTGADNLENYLSFSQAALNQSENAEINLLVLPFSMASHPLQISTDERESKLKAAEAARAEIEESCKQIVPNAQNCSVQLAPLLVRADAEDEQLSGFFEGELDGIYLLSGDPQIAMQVIGETPIQAALNQAYRQGVVIGGSTPGSFSTTLVQPSGTGSHLDSVFNFGALSLYEAPGDQTLEFRLPAVMVNQIFEQDQLGILLRSITIAGAPTIGFGLPAESNLLVSDNQRLQTISDNTPVFILDAESYHAAQSVRYTGAFKPTGLSNVLVHWLPSGEQSYDLISRQHSLAPSAERIRRISRPLQLPDGAGTLYLSADLIETSGLNTARTQFINQAGGQKAKLLILAAGYTAENEEEYLAAFFTGASAVDIQVLSLPVADASPITIPDDISGIVVSAPSTDSLELQQLQAIDASWRAGIPIWLNHAAVSWIGASYTIPASAQNQTEAFLFTPEQLYAGLNWLPAGFYTQIWSENRWAELFSLAYLQPQNLVLGLPSRTGLEISSLGARVWGEDVLFSLDLSQATLVDGGVANGLIDIFAPQELVTYPIADQSALPVAANTPALPTATFTQYVVTPSLTATATPTSTPSPVPTETLRVRPTATIKPTHTPPPIPPPPDPARMNFMVVITLIMTIIILFGIWLNRQWIKGNH